MEWKGDGSETCEFQSVTFDNDTHTGLMQAYWDGSECGYDYTVDVWLTKGSVSRGMGFGSFKTLLEAQQSAESALKDALKPYADLYARLGGEDETKTALYNALKEVMEVLRKEAPGTALNNQKYDGIGIAANDALAKARLEL